MSDPEMDDVVNELGQIPGISDYIDDLAQALAEVPYEHSDLFKEPKTDE